ncbi:PspA/IM30 family protein [filamentous cyanobacterium LEGE 11480]|uniref:PspA/IM30 family protein n=1 Tax=Romeriopsis navalis LEGE 11480 TaxID=2777977 RepID=A0A928Z1U8_9CYAN|nr:PspA/IM30 family protein [Romeriopsis navalis]MBE9029716.1 PspA/IM30 family protein [Romeriopsis navalis LEGE 11480]
MSLFDRVSRLVRANVNDAVSKAEDPQKILEQALIDMQDNFIKMKEAVASAIAQQRRSQKQLDNNNREAKVWQERAQLALQKGDEDLARQALMRKKGLSDAATALQAQLDQQNGQVASLKKNLMMLESKIAEAKAKKDMLKARAQAAKANEQLQSSMNSMSNSSAMAAFERMEDKVVQMESRSEAAAELAGAGLEAQFMELETGDVDYELEAMKQQMLGGTAATETQSLPQGTTQAVPQDSTTASAADLELEALKKQIENL